MQSRMNARKKGRDLEFSQQFILAELIGVVVFLLAPQLIAAFDSSPEIIRFGVEKARTAALFYCLLAFSHSIAAILRGAGKTMVSMIIMMMCWCVIRVSFPFRDDSAHSQHSGGILGISADMEFKFSGIFLVL